MNGVSLGRAKCDRATPKAIRVALADGKAFWLPQTVVHEDSEVWKEGDEGNLVVASWWAEKEGLS